MDTQNTRESIRYAFACAKSLGLTATHQARAMGYRKSKIHAVRHLRDNMPYDSACEKRISRLHVISQRVHTIFKTSKHVRQWMTTPDIRLGGKSPKVLILTGDPAKMELVCDRLNDMLVDTQLEAK